MSPPFYESSFRSGPSELSPARDRPLQQVGGTPATPPPDAPLTASGFALHANGAANGRQCGAVRVEPLALRWRSPLDARVAPEAVLAAGDLVAVAGELDCHVFSPEGEARATVARFEGLLCLDPRRGALVQKMASDVVWVDPWSGEVRARATLVRGGAARHVALAVAGDRAYAVADSMPRGGDDDEPRVGCVLEALAVRADGGRVTVRRERALHIDARHIAAAATDGFVAVATEGSIDLLSPALEHLDRFTSDAVPVALSASARCVAAVVRRASGAALWLIAGDGLLCDLPLGPPPPSGYGPALIGCDHRVYVPTSGAVTVVHPTGVTLGAYPVAHFAGAAVDAADTLLVSDGARLVAFRGEARAVLFAFGDERLRGAPVVTATGEVYCVTDKALYCLGPHS